MPNHDHPRIEIKPKTRFLIKEWLFIIIAITLLMYFYYFLLWWGVGPYMKEGIIREYLGSGWAYLEIGIQGVMFGVLFGIINTYFDKSFLARKSFGLVILIKTVLYFIAVGLSQYVVFLIYHMFHIFPLEQMQYMQEQLNPSFLLSVFAYFLIVILLINFLIHINRKFGYGILWSMLTGKYHKPRQEQRIFMFLDMKDSTSIIEQLGHVEYSKLIQSCIRELSELIISYKAQVYQYVGDEVVLTWPTSKGIKNMNCINLFFAFQQRLHKRRDYYKNKFNIVPNFKAGIAEGTATVTEVGDIKRELAYYGEVLHTAARLEKMCNQLGKTLLANHNLISKLSFSDGYVNEPMGKFNLKGKEKVEEVYCIRHVSISK